MDVFVSPEAAGVLESLGASVTGVRALSSVLPQVVLIVRTPLESQGTIGAQKSADPRVNTLMDLRTDILLVFYVLFKISVYFIDHLTWRRDERLKALPQSWHL